MADARRFAALVAYEGGRYHGWQRQAADRPSVQAAIEAALERLTGMPTPIIGAGRTDTGVHAAGQVIAFTSAWRHGETALTKALNAVLPGDIAVRAVIEAMGDFHPRYDASSRIYNYSLLLAPTRDPLTRDRAWHLYGAFDMETVSAGAALLVGEHDFAAFGRAPHGTNTVRTVFGSEWRAGAADPVTGARVIEYQIEANAFLEHMVRRIVGTLVDVGQGALTAAEFEAIFQGGELARTRTRTAPAYGLVLARVIYPPTVMVKLRHWQRANTTPGEASTIGEPVQQHGVENTE